MSLAGKLVYQLWHRPVGACAQSWREGGPLARRATESGRREMEAAAYRLPPLPAPSADAGAPLAPWFLTGRRYWYQTAFCLRSFGLATRRTLAPVILDDGSLEEPQLDALRRLCPHLEVDRAAAIEARLDAHLPFARFPSLRARRREFPLLRKLTDPHVGRTGWRLLMDSDLLFFRRPDTLVAWLDSPASALRAEDIANAYGYPIPLLNELAGCPVPQHVNTGLLGLRSEGIDWDRMEFWCRTLLERGGPRYYQEQALAALLLAGKECVVPPPADYVLLPAPPEAHECRAVMHHYVAESKRWYFQNNWKRMLIGLPAD